LPEADAKEKQERNPGALELLEETRDRLAELSALSGQAEASGGNARKELRLMVRASSPEVTGQTSDIARKAGRTGEKLRP
jgi:hypothetical protein